MHLDRVIPNMLTNFQLISTKGSSSTAYLIKNIGEFFNGVFLETIDYQSFHLHAILFIFCQDIKHDTAQTLMSQFLSLPCRKVEIFGFEIFAISCPYEMHALK